VDGREGGRRRREWGLGGWSNVGFGCIITVHSALGAAGRPVDAMHSQGGTTASGLPVPHGLVARAQYGDHVSELIGRIGPALCPTHPSSLCPRCTPGLTSRESRRLL